MITFTFTVHLSDDLIHLPERLRKALTEAHDNAARHMLGETRRQIIETDTVASKAFLNSVERKFEVRSSNRQIWHVGSPRREALFGERGRRPGKQPPTDAILRWMVFKGVGASEGYPRGLAFVIARKIAKRGWQGRFPFKLAAQSGFGQVQSDFNTAIGEAI